MARRWLLALENGEDDCPWRLHDAPAAAVGLSLQNMFQQKLLANMFDAVVFVDNGLRILHWNRGAERLTGVSESGVYQRCWAPSLIGLADEQGEPIRDEDCPVTYAIRTGVQWLRRLNIRGRNGRVVAVDAHAIPVTAADGVSRGLALVLHDASPETSLEARCENLKEKAARDPLTQLANRAEFDRTHARFVSTHLENGTPYSLVITDIDRFKLINDTYGHQAGDEVIQALAGLLKSACGPDDLAARYGGEEFVLLFADCDNGKALRRAEQLRAMLAELPQPSLNGKAATASFGVTELQPGDTPETMLRRADRALLMAKENGATGSCSWAAAAKAANRRRKSGKSRPARRATYCSNENWSARRPWRCASKSCEDSSPTIMPKFSPRTATRFKLPFQRAAARCFAA